MKRTRYVAFVWAGLTVAWATNARGQAAPGTPSDDTITRDQAKSGVMTVSGKEYEIHPATPTYGGDTGLFDLPSAYTLPRGKFSFSVYRTNLDRDPKDEDISIHGISFGYGATSRLELFGSLGLQNRIDADALFQPGFVNDYPLVSTGWETGFGDVRLGAKYKFLDDYRGQPVGLAIRADVKLPTAKDEKGLGTGKTSFGGAFILSKSLARKADIHAAIGYQFNGDPDQVNIGDAFTWGVGLNVPALTRFQLQAELTGASYHGADFNQTNPMDLAVGPVFWIKGFFIRPAVSWNLNFDDRGLGSSSKSHTGRRLSIGYHPGTAAREIVVPPPPPPPAANRPPTASCQADKSSVLPGEQIRWHASASDPDGDTLRYSWTVSSGRISGQGADATSDTQGVSAPATVTATVSVDDGRGGTVQARCTASVGAVERPKPQLVTCISAGFPRNLARLNNVDKACLDDVASRMQQDPRSTLVLKGHADRTELHSEVLARKRAEAAKDYLVRERGIVASRISARGVEPGATMAGPSQRGVEAIFVPEGATAPE
jgi:outer membrane protein OmpA-like peptidoglycan-associated protein